MMPVAFGVMPVFAKIWRWWLSEIRDAVPAWLLKRLNANRGRLIVQSLGSKLIATVECGAESLAIGTLDDRAAFERQLAQAYRALKCQRLTVILHPEPARVLTGRIELPAAAGDNLQEVVGYEMDRLTPFRAEDVYHDCKVMSRNDAAERIAVAVAVISRPLVDDAVDTLKKIGIEVDSVDPISADDEAISGLNLLPLARRPRPWRGHKWVIAMLALVAIAMGLASVAVPLERAAAAADELARAASRERKLAQDADMLQRKIDALEAERKIVNGSDQGAVAVSAVLDEVARVLPDDSWLFRFRWNGQRIELSGFSKDSTPLASLVEASPLLADVAFVAPVVIDPAVNRERFILSARAEVTAPSGTESVAP